MTGYGKAEGIVAEQRLVVEVRSLNSKQLDLNARIPFFLRDQEMAYRSAVAEACIRGACKQVVSAPGKAARRPGKAKCTEMPTASAVCE